MPQKSLDDLRYLITDRLSHHAWEALVKAFAGTNSDEKALAAVEMPCRGDTGYDKLKEEEVGLPRFILRH